MISATRESNATAVAIVEPEGDTSGLGQGNQFAAAGFLLFGLLVAAVCTYLARKRGLRYWRIVTSSLVVSVGASVLLLRTNASPLVLAALAAASLVALAVQLAKEGSDELARARDATKSSQVALDIVTSFPLARAKDADPSNLGVWSSPVANEVSIDNVTAPYVPRDIDPRLRHQLSNAAAGSNRPVVIAGGPKVGKSRSLLEAVRKELPEHWVVVLRKPHRVGASSTPVEAITEAATILRQHMPFILWVDDAHEHFDRGLTVSNLRRIQAEFPGTVIAMTVHEIDLIGLQRGLEDIPTAVGRGPSRGVDGSLYQYLDEGCYRLNGELVGQELEIAEEYYGDALSQNRLGDPKQLANSLAAVQIQISRYQVGLDHGVPGAALVQVALWWRAARLDPSISESDLRYLTEQLWLDSRDPSIESADQPWTEALTWATNMEHGSALLIRETPTESDRSDRWRAFDALLGLVEKPTAEWYWRYLFEITEHERGQPLVGSELTSVAMAAIGSKIPAATDILFSKLDSLDRDLASELSSFLAIFVADMADRSVEQRLESYAAETDGLANGRAFRGAIHLGNGRYDVAERLLRSALSDAKPDPQAVGLLVVLLKKTDRASEVPSALGAIAQSSDPMVSYLATIELADAASESGEVGDADALLDDLIADYDGLPSHPGDVALQVGLLLARNDRLDDSTKFFQTAVSSEVGRFGTGLDHDQDETISSASYFLWQALAELGQRDSPEAQSALQAAATSGVDDIAARAKYQIAQGLIAADDKEGVIPLLRPAAAIVGSDYFAIANAQLAYFLLEEGPLDEAIEALLLALASDDIGAIDLSLMALSTKLVTAKASSTEEAKEILRSALEELGLRPTGEGPNPQLLQIAVGEVSRIKTRRVLPRPRWISRMPWSR